MNITAGKRRPGLGALVLFGFGLGIVCGLLFGEMMAVFADVGRAYVRLLQMAVIPCITVSLIAGLGRLTPSQAGHPQRAWMGGLTAGGKPRLKMLIYVKIHHQCFPGGTMNKTNCLTSLRNTLIASCFALLTANAFAADILFVSDATNDSNIPGVLSADGHNVTTVLNDYVDDITQNNTVLQGDLTGYACIVWGASGEGYGDDHNATTINNLETFVNAGGTVFVTGYDSIASPLDEELIRFVGGTSSYDSSGDNITGPVTGSNILSTGLIDIVGVTPTGGYSDSDALQGLTASTTCVAERAGSSAGDCAWSVRTLGEGQIAYISNGEYIDESNSGNHPSWENTSTDGSGAYNAAVRNFAFNCGAPILFETQPVPTMSAFSIMLMAALLLALGIVMRRRVSG